MADKRTAAEIKRDRKRLTPESVTMWLFVILSSGFLANGAVLLTADPQPTPSGVPVLDPGSALHRARAAAAQTGGMIGMALTVCSVLSVWWVCRTKSAQSWRHLREWFGVIGGALALCLFVQLFLSGDLRAREPWLTIQALIPTTVLFVIMWTQVQIAVRRKVWLRDPASVELVFD